MCYNQCMGKIDKIKEQIGWLKVVFAILVAIDISLLGWMANHYDDINTYETKIYMAFFAIIIVSAIVVFVNKVAYRKIDELENL